MTATGIVIGTPLGDNRVAAGYMASVLKTQNLLLERGLHFSLTFNDNVGLIHFARNQIAAQFMAWERRSHLLFADSDMEWEAADVLRMVERDVEIVAAMAPYRSAERGFVGMPLFDAAGRYEQRNGLVLAETAGTGFMLIKRSVFERMARPEDRILDQDMLWRRTARQAEWHYDFFQSRLHNGVLESEDFSFCRRWRELGGKVWLDPTIKVKHHGMHVFIGDPMTAFEHDANRAKGGGANGV